MSTDHALQDHANVACGFHAGDPLVSGPRTSSKCCTKLTMTRSCKRPFDPARNMASKSEPTQDCPTSKALVDESKFHPRKRQDSRVSFADWAPRIKMSPEEITAMVRYQVGALKAFVSPLARMHESNAFTHVLLSVGR